MVDGSTRFVGKGLSTKSAAGKITATDAVSMGDRVTVSYHDMGGTMHAANVRITSKSTAKKIRLITKKFLPAGSRQCAVIGAQNLVIEDGVFGQLMDGRADFLQNRQVSVERACGSMMLSQPS